MLLGSVYYPVELGHDLVDIWLPVAGTQDLLEDPRVAERAACQEDGSHARLVICLARPLGTVEAPGQQDGRRERLGQFARQVVVRLALVLLRGVTRVQGDSGDAGVLHQPPSDLEAAPVPRDQA